MPSRARLEEPPFVSRHGGRALGLVAIGSRQAAVSLTPATDRASKALENVNTRVCGGCLQPFRPQRRNQQRCRTACRVLGSGGSRPVRTCGYVAWV
jgi:hypothetical protein